MLTCNVGCCKCSSRWQLRLSNGLSTPAVFVSTHVAGYMAALELNKCSNSTNSAAAMFRTR
jgi:uncharacterized protein (DUF2237 family)